MYDMISDCPIMAQNENQSVVNWEAYWSSAEEHNLVKHEPLISSTLGIFVLFFSTLLGTTANVLAFRYFFTKNNVFFNAFKMVALSDIVICLLSTFYGFSLVAKRAPLLLANALFCFSWNVSWKGLVRFSLHLVAIQSILRTLKICRPLTALPKHISTVLVSLDLIIISSVIFSSRTKFTPVYTKSYASCIEHKITESSSISVNPRWQIGVILYTAFPYPIIATCCVLCLVKLLRGKKVAAAKKKGHAHHRNQSMISLLVFSSTGLILNAASFGALSMRASFYEGFDTEDGTQVWFLLYGNIVFRQIFITLNSVMNPFIFLWRMPEFRQKVISMKVFQPFYAIFSKHCCKTGQIESRVDEKNNVNNNKLQNKSQLKVAQNKPHSIIHSNLRNNRKNDPTNLPGSMEDNSPVPYRNTLSIMATSSHLSSAETTSRKMPEINDSELCPLGPVIVHRSAIDLD